jgi:hypothetical protein
MMPTCLVTRLGSISFRKPLGDILELDDVLYIYGLTQSLLSISCIIDVMSPFLGSIYLQVEMTFWVCVNLIRRVI